MKLLRWLGILVGGVVALLLVAFVVAAIAYRDIPAEELEAKYANEASRFIDVDGVRMHYRDEGSGPPVVMLHAHFASLIGFDPWADALKATHRVVRFDIPSHGLTGPDPSGVYTIDRTMQLTRMLLDKLGVQKAVFAGTSMGGTIALHFASRYPERVEKLVLLSPGTLEGPEKMKKYKKRLGPSAELFTYITPRFFPKFMLEKGFGEGNVVPEELVDRWHDMWIREDQREAELARLRQYDGGDPEKLLASVTTPTLLLWGEANTTAPMEQAEHMVKAMKNVKSLKRINYPGVGHMAVQQAGARIVKDVIAYLAEPVDGASPPDAAGTPTADADPGTAQEPVDAAAKPPEEPASARL